MALLLKGGRVVDPAVGLDKVADVLIRDGVIVEVAENITLEKGRAIDCTGQIVVPGLFDLHVHLREPGLEYKETIESGTRAAVRGGFTGLACMANTKPVTDTGSAVRFIVERAKETAHCRVYPYGAITMGLKGEALAEMADMLSAGAVSFSDDGKGVQRSDVMRKAMEYAKVFGVRLVCHTEDELLAGSGCVHEGAASTTLGLPGIPSLAESAAAVRDIALSELTGCPIHICHVSAAETVEAIRQAKARGVDVTAEVTPHHLLLTEEDLGTSYSTNMKMNPPLRSARDREALIAGLLDGTLDAVATDHAPHAAHEKECEFELAAYGTVGLETALPLVYTGMVETGVMDLHTLVDRMAHAPRRVLGLPPVTLAAGSVADITVFNPAESVVISESYLESKSKNSAFIGRKVSGIPSNCIVGGDVVLEQGRVMN